MAIFAICTNVFAQQTYFQQEVNYKIDVKLNDVDHSLKAFEELQYINNASNSISYIYFHLWPNAYKNNETEVIMCVMRKATLVKVRNLLKEVDPDAFMIVSTANEVFGEGFKNQYETEI